MTLEDLKGKTLISIFPTVENDEFYKKYGERLKNKLYKILCDKEEGKEWKSQRNAFLILLYGTTKGLSVDVMEVVGKIGALDILDESHFKKTIFESMNLIDKIFNIKR
jgi:hypothetical protein